LLEGREKNNLDAFSYDFTLIKSGNLLEAMSFSVPIWKSGAGGSLQSNKRILGVAPPGEIEEPYIDRENDSERDCRKEYLSRAKRHIERVAYSNFDTPYTSLITLTYKANIKDLPKANHDFHLFVKRITYWIEKYKYPYPGFQFKYICKPEFQDRGAIHYHLVTNLRAFPFAKKNVREWKRQKTLPPDWDIDVNLQDIWNGKTRGKGCADLEPIEKDRMITVISYLTDYMTKQFKDERFCGKKAYSSSHNLDRPIQIYNDDAKRVLEALLESESVKEKDCWTFTPDSLPDQTINFRKYIITQR